MGILSGKKALVLGIANERSLAFAIARRLADEGAALAVTYQGAALEARVRKLAEALPAATVVPCDVTSDAEISSLFERVEQELGGLDILVHAVAYAGREALSGAYSDVSREGFLQAMDISVFSFTALARHAAALMKDGGAMLTLSYYGAEKVVRNYNVMGVAKAALEASVRYLAADLGSRGIRVNAISAGPVKTLSAKGVRDFNSVLSQVEERAPLRRNITSGEVGAAGFFLLSDLSGGMTGEIIHVDAGYNIIGL
jgi:enoyl-[acyl-carrier protein] reductase I